jgi:GAF domain-containing protein/HAMP domain-containing protein
MAKWGIGQKLTVVVGVIFLLFAAGVSFVVGTSSSNDLEAVKQEDLARMSQIFARRITEMEQNAAETTRSMEESEPMVEELQLLTNFGPYYADPASSFAEEFMQAGEPIEPSSQIYAFQAQLNLVQLLRSAQRLNELTSISFYLISPFEVVVDARPVLALRLDEERIVLSRFTEKVDLGARVMYSIDVETFSAPAPGYFDISAAYSAPPAQFYAEQGFTSVEEAIEYEYFSKTWDRDAPPRSDVIVREGVPVLQTWYPVKVPVPDPETWEAETVAVGVALVEQEFDVAMMSLMADQLGLNVGLAQGGQLLITSLEDDDGATVAASLEEEETILTLDQRDFYFAREPIAWSDPSTSSDLRAVVFSPVSEVEEATRRLVRRIGLTAILGTLLTAAIVYFGVQNVAGRPLDGLIDGVERIAAGDLDYQVPVRSEDELGQLAAAFNDMAARLRGLIGSLEERVEARTRDLEERAQYLEATAEVSHDAASELDLDELLARVVRLISVRFGFYHSGLFLIDKTGEWAVLQAASSVGGQRMLERGHRLKVGEKGTVGYVTARGEPRIALDVGEDAVFFDNPDLPETRSAMTLPLRARGEIIGALDVQSKEPGAFTNEDAAVMQILADQVGMAISNARLFQQAQESLEAERRAYGDLSRQAWLEAVRRRAHLGFASNVQGTRPVEGRSPEVMERASREGQRVQQDGTTLALPVKIRGNVVGAVKLCKSDGDEAWSEEEIALMETVTEQLNVALESARLYEDTQRRAARERLSGEIAAHMRETLNVETILRAAASEIRQSLELGRVVVSLRAKEDHANEGG